MSNIDYTFWPASLRGRTFQDQVKAAVAGGFNSLAIASSTYFRARQAGMSTQEMKALANDNGVPLRYFDALTGWGPVGPLNGFNDELRTWWSTPSDICMKICDELELVSVLACAAYEKDTVPVNALIDGFGALCDRAAQSGIWVDLEPMPFFGCPDLASAWAIVEGANQPNSGILIDTWHFFKGAPDFELLKSIPGERFVTMQICDGLKRQISGSLLEDTGKHRLFPGEGELPVVELLQVLFAKGHIRSIGPEIFSLQADTMSAEKMGGICGATSWKVLREAGIPVPNG